jgi:hypothetical protein
MDMPKCKNGDAAAPVFLDTFLQTSPTGII